MVMVAERIGDPLRDGTLKAMFEARKRVFVDLLKWDVPVIDGRFEVDQFDDEHAVYLVVRGPGGEHFASTRLLGTERAHILDSLFPDLCEGPAPRGPEVAEITRFCLDRRLNAAARLAARNRLVSALATYALMRGITVYTGVAELAWLQQILAFGWRCRPLGAPVLHGGRMLGALRIDIDAHTPALLARNGIYTETDLDADDRRDAA